MTVLIDSSAWIEYFKDSVRGRKAAEYIDGDAVAIISAVNLQELARYLHRHAPDDAQLTFILRRASVEPLSEELALRAARVQEQHAVGLADAATFATAQHTGSVLVTCDNDFRGLPDVRIL